MCDIDKISNTEITCKTPAASPPDANNPVVYPGSAGVHFQVWKDTGDVDVASAWAVPPGEPDYETVLDQGFHIDQNGMPEHILNGTDYTARMYGILTAPYTGTFWLRLAASDTSSVWYTNSSLDASNAEFWDKCEGRASGWTVLNGCGNRNKKLFMSKGQQVFVGVIHHQSNATEDDQFLRLVLLSEQSSVTDSDSEWADRERQVLYIKEDKRDEIQLVEFNKVPTTNDIYFSMNGVSGVNFK